MHFLPTALALLSLTTSLHVLAAPLTFTDIERRWSAGESDASIHSHHNPRSASPAWPLALSGRDAAPEPSTDFAESYDAVTQQQGMLSKRNNSAALMARIRDFAARLLQSKGETQMIASEKMKGVAMVGEEDEAPVLRPMKVKYRFAA